MKRRFSEQSSRIKLRPISLIVCVVGLIFVLSFVCPADNTPQAQAAIAKLINYQAKILDSTDNAVADGNYDVVFRICELSDCSGGSDPLWTEDWDSDAGNSEVSVSHGLFTVQLGTFTTLDLDFNSSSYYLGVNFNSDGWMTPQKTITGTPYSLNTNLYRGQDLAALTENFSIKGDDTAARTITLGQTGSFDDILIVDTGNFTLSSGGSGVFYGDLVVGGTTSTVETLSGGFTLDGDDLFVAGSLGVESNVYTDGSMYFGAYDSILYNTEGHGELSISTHPGAGDYPYLSLISAEDLFLGANDQDDDYITISVGNETGGTQVVPAFYFSGIGNYSNPPGFSVNDDGEIVYRDEDEPGWTTLDSLSSGAGLWTLGTFATYRDDDVVVGGDIDETLSNTGFSLNGSELFVSGMLGVESDIYTDGSMYFDDNGIVYNSYGTGELLIATSSSAGAYPYLALWSAEDLFIGADDEPDDYITISVGNETGGTQVVPAFYFSGIGSYTYAPGFSVNDDGEIVYRDEDLDEWVTLDSLSSGGGLWSSGTYGIYYASDDVIVGSDTADNIPLTNTNFVLDGNDLYVEGMLGVSSSIYTEDTLTIDFSSDNVWESGLIINVGSNGALSNDGALLGSSTVITPHSADQSAIVGSMYSLANGLSSGDFSGQDIAGAMAYFELLGSSKGVGFSNMLFHEGSGDIIGVNDMLTLKSGASGHAYGTNMLIENQSSSASGIYGVNMQIGNYTSVASDIYGLNLFYTDTGSVNNLYGLNLDLDASGVSNNAYGMNINVSDNSSLDSYIKLSTTGSGGAEYSLDMYGSGSDIDLRFNLGSMIGEGGAGMLAVVPGGNVNDDFFVFNEDPSNGDQFLWVNNDASSPPGIRLNTSDYTMEFRDSNTGYAWTAFGSGSGLWTLGTHGIYYSGDDVIVGADPATDTPLLNNGFSLSGTGNDLYVVGSLGVAGDVYTDNSFIAGSTLTLNDDYIRDSGDLNLQADGDTDDYIYLSTRVTAGAYTVPSMFFAGIGNYTNDPGFSVNDDGQLVYRDEDSAGWIPFDDLLSGGGAAGSWTDGGSYLYPTTGEYIGNNASAGANKISGLYLADSSNLGFGNDNDVLFNFSGSTLGVNFANNSDINFDSNTLFLDSSEDGIGIGTNSLSANDKLKILLGANEKVYIDAYTTQHTGTGGALDIDYLSGVGFEPALDLLVASPGLTSGNYPLGMNINARLNSSDAIGSGLFMYGATIDYESSFSSLSGDENNGPPMVGGMIFYAQDAENTSQNIDGTVNASVVFGAAGHDGSGDLTGDSFEFTHNGSGSLKGDEFNLSATGTGNVTGSEISLTASSSSSSSNLYGFDLDIQNESTGTSNIYGLDISIQDSGAITNNLYGISLDVDASGGASGDAYGMRIRATDSGTLDSLLGLFTTGTAEATYGIDMNNASLSYDVRLRNNATIENPSTATFLFKEDPAALDHIKFYTGNNVGSEIVPAIFFAGIGNYTNDPGFSVNDDGKIVYRDEDSANWKTLDSLETSSYWSKSGTDLSPTTAGDDILLNAGETLTLSDMTQGSLLFAGASGLVSQDNSYLYYDSSNHKLGLGTNNLGQARMEIEVEDNTGLYALLLDNNDVSGSPTVFKINNAGSGYSIWVDEGDVVFDEDLIVGGSTSRVETLENNGFSLSGDDLFVAGDLGVESGIYTDGSLVVGNTTTISDGSITQSTTGDGSLLIQTTGGANPYLALLGSSQVWIGDNGDDFIKVDSRTDTQVVPTILFGGVSSYTDSQSPGLSVNNNGQMVYRDALGAWTTFENLYEGLWTSGTFATYRNDDVVIGGNINQTIANEFALTGNDLFVSGALGVEENIYTDGNLYLHTDVTSGGTDIGITFGNFALPEQFIWDGTNSYFSVTDDLVADSFITTNLTIDNGSITQLTGSPLAVILGGVAGDDFTVDSTTLVVESDADQVGIGLSDPSSKLHVKSDSYTIDNGDGLVITNTGGYDPTIVFQPSEGFSKFIIGVDNDDSDKFKFGIESFDNALLTLKDGISNWVGIDNSDPESKLHIKGDDGNYGLGSGLIIEQTNTNYGVQTVFVNPDTEYSIGIDPTDDYFKISPGIGLLNDNYFTMDQVGNIGIFDNTPDHTLDVAGNIGLYTIGYINWGDTDGSSGYGFRSDSGTMQYKDEGGNWTDFFNSSDMLWTLGTFATYRNDDVIIGADTPDTTPLTNENFVMNGNDLYVQGMLGVNSDIYTDGGLVVGNTTTIRDGSITQSTGGSLDIILGSAEGDNFTVDGDSFVVKGDTGNVGINTADPQLALHITGVAATTGNLSSGDLSPDAHLEVSANGTTGGSVFLVSSNDDNDGDIFTIKENNDIGVGTNAPDSILDIEFQDFSSDGIILNNTASVGDSFVAFQDNGTTKFSLGLDGSTDYFRIGTTDLDTGISFTIDDSGYVGIVDGTPDHTLDVDGNIGLYTAGYINWGDTDGESGYGFRSDSGTLQYKDDGGAWADLEDLSNWIDEGDYLRPLTNGDDVRIYDNTGNDYVEILHNGNDAVFNFNGADEVQFDTDTLVIDVEDDRVGIGKTNPTATLDIFHQEETDSSGSTYAQHTLFDDSGLLSSGTHNSYGHYILFDRSGYSGTSTVNNYGLNVNMIGTGSGTANNYGVYSKVNSSASGTTTSIAGYFSALGNGTRYGILVDAGDTILDDDLVVGGSTSRTSTLANGFVMDGDDLFVAGDLGVEGNIYTDHNISLDSGGYINWGANIGSSGYGFRDNAGTMEYKDSGGSWQSFDVSGSILWEDGTHGVYEDDEAVIVGADAVFTYVDDGGVGAGQAGDLRVASSFEAMDTSYFGGNLYVGASTSAVETLLNNGFQMGGDDLFVAGMLGVESDVYTDGSFIAGNTLTMTDGSITQSTGSALAINLGGAAGDDLNIDSNSFVVESDTNEVGIGTANPFSPFHILDETGYSNGDTVKIQSDGGGDPAIGFATDQNYFTLGYDVSSDSFKIGVDDITTNTRFTIDSDGDIGIADDTPDARLDVYSSEAISTGLSYSNIISEAELTGTISSSAAELFGIYVTADITEESSGGLIYTTGGRFEATGDNDGSATTLGYGVYSSSENSDTNYGVYSKASGSGDTNYGIYSTVNGATNNYAGIFMGGEVGIGTSSPGAYLDVDYDDTIADGSFFGSVIDANLSGALTTGNTNSLRGLSVYASTTGAHQAGTTVGTTGLYINTQGSSTSSGDTANYGLYLISSNADTNYGLYSSVTGSGDNYAGVFMGGDVGIGTTTPSSRLDVESDQAYDGILINNTSASDYDPQLGFQLSGTSIFTLGVDDSDGDKFKIGTSRAETNTRLTIDSDGDVGIGDTSPGGRLEVVSSSALASASNFYTMRTETVDTGAVSSGTDNTYGHIISVTRGGATGGTIQTFGLSSTVTGDTGGNSSTRAGYFSASGADINYGIYSYVSGSGTNYAGIFDGGSVGIGDPTPDAILDVYNDGAGDSFRVDDSVSDLSPFVIDENGYVGIMENDPQSPLHVGFPVGKIVAMELTNLADVTVASFNSTGNLLLGGMVEADEANAYDLEVQSNSGPEFSLLNSTTDISADVNLASVYFKGLDSGASSDLVGAKIVATAEASWGGASDYDAPTNLKFYTQSDGATNDLLYPRLFIESSGYIAICADGCPAFGIIDGEGDLYVEDEFEADGNASIGGNLQVATNNTTLFASGASVFNDSGADADFRVESSGSNSMFFVDGGDNEIGIGTNDPRGLVHAVSNGDALLILQADQDTNSATDNPRIEFREGSSIGTIYGMVGVEGTANTTYSGSILGATYVNSEESKPVQLSAAGVSVLTAYSGGTVYICDGSCSVSPQKTLAADRGNLYISGGLEVKERVIVGTAGTSEANIGFASSNGDMYVENDFEVDGRIVIAGISGDIDIATGDGDLYVDDDLEADGEILFEDVLNQTAGTYYVTIDSNGYLKRGAVVSSSEKYKDNISDYDFDVSKIMQLRPVTFDWNELRPEIQGEEDFGLVAEEVDQLFPELVLRNGDEIEGVHYQKLAIILLKGYQEQQKQIDDLVAQLNTADSGSAIDIGESITASKWSINENGVFSAKVDVAGQAETKDMYAMSSTEVEFTISGSAQLQAGTATIHFEDVDPEFNKIVSGDTPLKIIVTPTESCKGVYVSQKTSYQVDSQMRHISFTVEELDNGMSDASFDWIVIGRRAGYENEESGTPEDPAPEDPAPEDPAPEDPAPEDPAPEDPAPEDPAPEDPAP